MKVFFLPLEPMDERYTRQMLFWVTNALLKLKGEGKIIFSVILPTYEGEIDSGTGQWLDTFKTCHYKSAQLQMVADLFKNGEVEQGSLFLLGDVWFPGIEQIKYMAEMANIRVYLAGWHYAGMFDPNDVLHRTLDVWASQWERNLLTHVMDYVCVGSDYHKNFILRGAPSSEKRLYEHGLVWEPEDVKRFAKKNKEKIVVFPHRYAIEKRPEDFFALAKKFKTSHPAWKFIYSTNSKSTIPMSDGVSLAIHKTKSDYYEFLSKCSIFYSSAVQETFGYSLHESIALGLSIVAPYRASYPQMLHQDANFMYKTGIGEELLQKCLDGKQAIPPYEWTAQYSGNAYKFLSAVMEDIKNDVCHVLVGV